MDIREDIKAYKERRKLRLEGRGVHTDADTEKKSGNTRLPYALCKSEGINTEGMTPAEAWAALKSKTGTSAKEAYSDMSKRNQPRSGELESLKKRESGDYGIIGSGNSATVKNPKAWESAVDNDLKALPLGAIINTGPHKYVKLRNGVWGDGNDLQDPRYQVSHDKLVGKLMDDVAMFRKVSYEVPKRKKKESRDKLKKERKSFLSENFPNQKILSAKTNDGYTDFVVGYADGKGSYKTYRVYEDLNGKTKMCPIYK